MSYTRFIYFIAFIAFGLFAFNAETPPLSPNQSVAQLLETFGDKPLPHKVKTGGNVSAERGKDIVLNGFSDQNGRKSKRQSKHFTCIACHNVEREDPDLANPSPEARLKYVTENGLPFLQGSPLYGIVNRTKFYNGDYYKKYGDLVNPARDNIREAIQLCAVECSQGRALKSFEIESILAYLWTIDLKLSDLLLAPEEMELVQRAFDTGRGKEAAIEVLKSKYMDHSPATFVDPPKDRNTGDGMVGNPVNGSLLYKASCQYCHYEKPFSFLTLDDDRMTFDHLLRKAGTYQPHSIYQVIRYGTPPKGGKEAYMPHYTKEKMTDQQMADLRAYIEMMANS